MRDNPKIPDPDPPPGAGAQGQCIVCICAYKIRDSPIPIPPLEPPRQSTCICAPKAERIPDPGQRRGAGGSSAPRGGREFGFSDFRILADKIRESPTDPQPPGRDREFRIFRSFGAPGSGILVLGAWNFRIFRLRAGSGFWIFGFSRTSPKIPNPKPKIPNPKTGAFRE